LSSRHFADEAVVLVVAVVVDVAVAGAGFAVAAGVLAGHLTKWPLASRHLVAAAEASTLKALTRIAAQASQRSLVIKNLRWPQWACR
jgi:hypothetical protein